MPLDLIAEVVQEPDHLLYRVKGDLLRASGIIIGDLADTDGGFRFGGRSALQASPTLQSPLPGALPAAAEPHLCPPSLAALTGSGGVAYAQTLPALTITHADLAVLEDRRNISLCPSLSPVGDQAITGQFGTGDGTAVTPYDYADRDINVTFNAQEASKCADIPIVNDIIVEQGETFRVRVSGNTAQATIADTPLTITVRDNDNPRAPEDLAAAPADVRSTSGVSVSVELSPGRHLPWDQALTGTVTLDGLDHDSYSSIVFRADVAGHEDYTATCFGDDTGRDIVVGVDASRESFAIEVFKPCNHAAEGFRGTNVYMLDLSVSRASSVPGDRVELSPARLQVDTPISAALADPDGGILNIMWRWERSPNRRDWTPIDGANTASYIPASADAGQYLQAVATYDDDQGPTKVAAAHTTSSVVDPTRPPPPPPPPPLRRGGGPTGGGPAPLPEGSNQPPTFTEGSRTMRTAAENAPEGVDIGAPIAATDPEGDSLTYKLAGTAADAFGLDPSSGQLRTKAALDYETNNSYRVTVEVWDSRSPEGEADRRRDDSIAVTVNIANRDDTGRLTLSAPTPRSGQPLEAVLVDPDGVANVSWVWERSADRTTWAPIPDATSAAYTPDADDEGHHLRVVVSYGDPFGSGKTVTATPDAGPPVRQR